MAVPCRQLSMRLGVVGAAALLCACAAIRRQDLHELYPDARAIDQPPLIVIPGIMGSRLSDPETGKTLWPVSLKMLIAGWRIKDLAVPIPEEITASAANWRASGILVSSLGRDYYKGLLETLEEVGYDCVTQYEIEVDTNCVVLVWDWRKGYVSAAADLAGAIGRLRSLRRRPEMKVDILAHSAGSLIARYYARFGGRDVVEADADRSMSPPHSIHKMVLIGPPNDGSLSAAEGLMRGYRAGPFTVRPDVLATFETSYQSLPNGDWDWLVDPEGHAISLDLYDVRTWQRYEESIFDPKVRQRVLSRYRVPYRGVEHLEALDEHFRHALARGERFHQALSAPFPGDAEISYFVIGSDCEKTSRRAVLETVAGEGKLRFRPNEISYPDVGIDYERLMFEAGDGRVPRSSLLDRVAPDAATTHTLPIENVVLICGGHSNLAANVEVQHNVLNMLFDEGFRQRERPTAVAQGRGR